MKEYFQVTDEHILNGTKHPVSCPIALALKSRYSDPHVYETKTLIEDLQQPELGSDPFSFTHSPAVEEWVINFDAGRKVNPIVIKVDHDKLIISKVG